jgi:hypothetical protein
MNNPDHFALLVASVQRIACHPFYPGIEQAVDQCLSDIDELMDAGRISGEQCQALRLVLLGITMIPSSAANAA